MIRLALIEDDEKIRNYLSALISGSGEFSLEAAFSSAEAAMEYFSSGKGNDVEVLMSDIELPGKNGIEFVAWFKPLHPMIQVMILSSYDDADRVFRALKAG